VKRTTIPLLVCLCILFPFCAGTTHVVTCMEDVCRPWLNLTIGITELPRHRRPPMITLLTRHSEEQCFANRTQQPPVMCEYRVSPNRMRFRFRISVPATRLHAASDCAIEPRRVFAMKWAEFLEVERIVDPQNLSCIYLAHPSHREIASLPFGLRF